MDEFCYIIVSFGILYVCKGTSGSCNVFYCFCCFVTFSAFIIWDCFLDYVFPLISSGYYSILDRHHKSNGFAKEVSNLETEACLIRKCAKQFFLLPFFFFLFYWCTFWMNVVASDKCSGVALISAIQMTSNILLSICFSWK